MEVRKPVRLGTRVSADTNDWLDMRAKEMGLTKSAVINIAVESYRKEVETVRTMPELSRKINELSRLD